MGQTRDPTFALGSFFKKPLTYLRLRKTFCNFSNFFRMFLELISHYFRQTFAALSHIFRISLRLRR
jgi:hypothetical protein